MGRGEPGQVARQLEVWLIKRQQYLDAYLEGRYQSQTGHDALPGHDQVAHPRPDRLIADRRCKMIKARTKAAGLPENLSPHSLRGTGITNYLENGGSLGTAQRIAAHGDPRTTKLYDRRGDRVERGEIERIRFGG